MRVEGEALEGLVDSAVTSACEEDVGLDLGGLIAGGVRAIGGDDGCFYGVVAKGLSNLFDDAEAMLWVATGVGVVKERGSAHAGSVWVKVAGGG